MKRNFLLISLSLVLSLLVVACGGGGGGGGAPVDMTKYEGNTINVEHPKDWNLDSMDMFGMAIIVASGAELEAEGFMEAATPGDFFGDQGGVLIMSVPPELAEGDIGFSEEDMQEIESEPGVEVVKKGDITIDGAKGYEIVAKGKIEDMGDEEIGVHIASFQCDAGQVVFMGISPTKDMDKNLDIFDYMLQSIKFAE